MLTKQKKNKHLQEPTYDFEKSLTLEKLFQQTKANETKTKAQLNVLVSLGQVVEIFEDNEIMYLITTRGTFAYYDSAHLTQKNYHQREKLKNYIITISGFIGIISAIIAILISIKTLVRSSDDIKQNQEQLKAIELRLDSIFQKKWRVMWFMELLCL